MLWRVRAVLWRVRAVLCRRRAGARRHGNAGGGPGGVLGNGRAESGVIGVKGWARDRWAGYAAAVTALVAPGGALLIVAHAPGAELGTQPIAADDLAALLPGFELVRTTPTPLAGASAQLFELTRRDAPARDARG